jgi:hypothetical protein
MRWATLGVRAKIRSPFDAKFRPTQNPPRLVHLHVTTLNSYLFGSPTCFYYRLVARSDWGGRTVKGNARHFWLFTILISVGI